MIFARLAKLTLIHARAFSSSPMAHSKSIGFIGLGNMGKGMAQNLINNGENVIVYDVNVDAIKALEESGAKSARSPGQVAEQCDRVITMLPNNEIVKDVYLSPEEGILSRIAPNSILIDSSTIDPAVSNQLAFKCREKQVAFLDAPVSGGVNAAKAGTLTFMVGAEKTEDFDRAKAVLSYMGKNITHCGNVGTGQAVKICNNMLLAISMIGVAETMNLGQNLGLDPKVLSSILSTATGRCWSVDTYNPVPGVMENVPASNEYKGGFGTLLMVKDLGLSQDAATRTKSATPLGSLAHQIYRIMVNAGFGDKDFSSAYKFLREKA